MHRPSCDGLLVLDKPGGLTSRAAVDHALNWLPPGTRVGHTGTLDPLATGVLVLCTGAATRLTEYVQRMAKTYRAGLILGRRSDTEDADGTLSIVPVDRPPEQACVAACVARFVGEIEQVPPAYSAAKVVGRRAYNLARQGRAVALTPRRVIIHGIDLIAFEYPRLDLEIRCGKGTYIRALARDLGEALGCGALVQTLRRTRVGPFTATDAIRLDEPSARARSRLLPLAAAVSELPHVTLDAAQALRLRQGQAVPCLAEAAGECAVFDARGTLLAVAVSDRAQEVLRPVKVLSPGE